MQTDIQSFRKGAECHRQIRKYAQQIIKPGRKMIDIVIDIERCLNFITNAHGLDIGQSFPTGCSLNNVAAHYTPNPGDETVLQKDDICKIDFGTHVNGLVIDCAFSVAFNPQYDNLLLATKEATNEGIKTAGIDVRMDEIGKVIQEVIESYEVEIDGKMKKLKPIKNLCGHTVGRYKVHAGKTVPCVVNYENVKMEEGEMYAIETFASTGKGEVKPIIDCSHYMLEQYATGENLRKKEEKELFEYIKGKYSTLAWCKRWLVEEGFKNVSLPLRHMINAGVVQEYPPLADIDGSFTSQFEHTFMLLPTKKEIFTVGDDY